MTIMFSLLSGGSHFQLFGNQSNEHLPRATGEKHISFVYGPSYRCKLLHYKSCHAHMQVIIDTDKTTYTLRLQTKDQLDHMVSHINYALSRVFNNSIYA